MAPDTDDWLGIKELVAHSKLSDKTIRRAIAAREHPLPSHRVGRRVLIKRSDFDTWVKAGSAPQARPRPADTVEARVQATAAEILRSIRGLN